MRHGARAPVRTVVSAIGSLLLACAAMSSAHAQVVIYRCTDASGAVSLQNGTPCPKGTRQQKRVMEAPAPVAAPTMPTPIAPSPVAPVATQMPDTPAPPEPAKASTAVAEAPRVPPPELFECRTWDRTRYLSEQAQPPPRCAPMQVTGLDGQGGSAGGVACQMVEDQCQRIPDARLCEAWQQRLRDAEAASVFGGSSSPEPGPVDPARVRGIVDTSTCAAR